jgi:tRNA(Ile)-lysidine synthetase-like protein
VLDIPCEFDLGDGWILKAELPLCKISAKNEARTNQNPYQAWVNWGDRDLKLLIRKRNPGDRFQPMGMEGQSMKISDLMVNEKIPRRARANWPLICSDDEIVWVPGLHVGHLFRIMDCSQQIVKLVVKKR